MAKNEKKLEMVPAVAGSVANSNAFIGALVIEQMPDVKKLKKISLPSLVKPDEVPIGATISGEIRAVVASISGAENMRESKLLHLVNKNNPAKEIEFLFPLTGTIKKAIGGVVGAEKQVGNTLFLTRLPDGETMKYAAKGEGPKKVFQFDIYVSTK